MWEVKVLQLICVQLIEEYQEYYYYDQQAEFIRIQICCNLMSQLRLSKIIVLVLLLSLVIVSSHREDNHASQDDDHDYHDFPTLDEKESQSQEDQYESTEKLRPILDKDDLEKLHERVDDMIGIQEEEVDTHGHVIHPANLTRLKKVLKNNKEWAANRTNGNPDFFKNHESGQKPSYLWIGCADSRMPANEILGLDYGELFVLRNVANIVSPSDISSLAVIQYAVEVLKVTDIIVAGHYGCGGVKAAVTKYNHGPLEAWLSKLRRIRHKHAQSFAHLTSVEDQANLLVQINVKEQVFNVASTPFVQQAWKDGQQLRVHGVVYDMMTGRLVDLHLTMHSIEQLPDELAVFEK